MNSSAPIRYAIWAAVSTEEQAQADRYSLSTQVERSRAAAQSRGWVEAAGPYIVAGESRTRWVNLSDAERAIPQLRQLLDDAQTGKFDLVICAEYDRFRDLLDSVARTLNHYGVQLYSAAQPIEPQDPANFNPYATDSEFLMRGMNAMISRAAVANLRRKYASEMPKRVTEKGLTPTQLPWGYRKPLGKESDPDAIPVQVPEQIAYLRTMKDMVLAGKSTYQVVQYLLAENVPPPKPHMLSLPENRAWQPTTVKRILVNPFYAGYVRWGVTKSHLDPRIGKVKKEKTSQPIMAPGKHDPVWDDATLQQLIAEFEQRAPRYRGRVSRQLTALMHCGVCGAMMWRTNRYQARARENRRITWHCNVGKASHVIVDNDKMLDQFAQVIEKIITEQPAIAEVRLNEQELRGLRTKRERIGDAYADGLFDISEFSNRVREIDQRISTLEKQAKQALETVATRQARNNAISALKTVIQEISLNEFIHTGDHLAINALLRKLIAYVVVDSNGNITEVVQRT
jgi:hypothetical protein